MLKQSHIQIVRLKNGAFQLLFFNNDYFYCNAKIKEAFRNTHSTDYLPASLGCWQEFHH